MTDSRQTPHGGENIFGAAEPARDVALAALIGDVVGAPPFGDVDWAALGARIASARARQRMAWWSYTARWERRMLPVALAAGLAGVLALWGLGMPAAPRLATAVSIADPMAEIVDGTATADAARSFARSITSGGDQTTAGLY